MGNNALQRQGTSPPTQQAKLGHNAKNRVMVAKFHSIAQTLFDAMLMRGVFGAGTIKFIVQDGTIQYLEECMERKHREDVSPSVQDTGRADLQHSGNGYPKGLPPSAASTMRSRLDDISIEVSVEHEHC